MAKLVVLNAAAAGRSHELNVEKTTIGRVEDNSFQIAEPSVSSHHCEILVEGDNVVVKDLNSTNGTFVNDKPASMSKLKDGDYLRIGNWIFRYLAGGNIEAEYHEEIYRLTIIDGLTDIPNKRYLLEFLDRELARSERYRRPLALLLFDIDHFKAVNDQMGHLGGDFTLRELAARVKAGIRKEELFARYGGEEFAVVLPETTREGAIPIAERLRSLVEAQPFTYDGRDYAVTVSIGVATTTGEEALTPGELLCRADERLYQAKRDGRNRVAA